MEQVKNKIVDIIEQILEKRIDLNYSFDNGDFDSLSAIRLIIALEDEFQIEIAEEYLDFRLYNSVEDLFIIVNRYVDARQPHLS